MKLELQKNRLGSKFLALAVVSFGAVTGWGQTTFNYTGAIQTYTVPAGITSINISASGAQGGGNGGGGLGATMSGDFAVTPGQVLTVVVGQEGQLQIGGNTQNSSGGGGGSFVYDASNVLFVAAGGGGGKCNYSGSVPLHADANGLTGTSGGASSDGNAGGTAGNGGNAGFFGGGWYDSGGGAGWLTPGNTATFGGKNAAGGWAGGDPYCGGGGGGCGGYGGFGGGGGGGNDYGGGGGGGGYSGGGGGTDPTHGGGGGSYNIGTNQMNTGGNHTGNGIVVITPNCTPTSITPDAGSLADANGMCSIAMPTAPTATNDCGAVYDGTPDVTFPVTAIGTTVVTWTFDDGQGNVATQTQNFINSGADVSVTVTSPTLTANATSATFQWLDCNDAYAIITGETTNSYAPTATVGSYAVEVTQSGCVDTSACFVLDFSGISESGSTSINVFPNPSADGFFNITYNGQILKVEVLDLVGRKVTTPITFKDATLDASLLVAGNYIVVIYTDQQIINKEIVIVK